MKVLVDAEIARDPGRGDSGRGGSEAIHCILTYVRQGSVYFSPFSTARPTRVIGRFPISVFRPERRISASVIPARPNGGSM